MLRPPVLAVATLALCLLVAVLLGAAMALYPGGTWEEPTRQGHAHGLSLAEVSKRLGQSSRNAYARYERGASVPTIDKLQELLTVVTGQDFVLKPA